MTYPGRFADQLLPDRLDHVSLSFLVEELDIRRGGVAANICFGLGQLGLRPSLVGAVGADFADYRSWLERHGVDTQSVHVSDTHHTARFLCTTDRDQNQIASFYPGAMSEARDIELAPVAERLGGLDLVLVSPNDPVAMVRHTEECRNRGYSFVADPSQQLTSLDAQQVRQLIDGAAYLFNNEYERELLETRSGWSSKEILERVGTWITTLGKNGAMVERKGEDEIRVPTAKEERIADPTGVGDAFRAGFIAAVAWELDLLRAAQVGNMLGTYVVETTGTQEYTVEPKRFLERLAEAYGDESANEVEPHLLPG